MKGQSLWAIAGNGKGFQRSSFFILFISLYFKKSFASGTFCSTGSAAGKPWVVLSSPQTKPQMTCLLVSAPNEAGSEAGRNQRSYFYKTGVSFVHAVQRQSRTIWLSWDI